MCAAVTAAPTLLPAMFYLLILLLLFIRPYIYFYLSWLFIEMCFSYYNWVSLLIKSKQLHYMTESTAKDFEHTIVHWIFWQMQLLIIQLKLGVELCKTEFDWTDSLPSLKHWCLPLTVLVGSLTKNNRCLVGKKSSNRSLWPNTKLKTSHSLCFYRLKKLQLGKKTKFKVIICLY